eukprot:CAMPEP_0170175708 /NCGR_PEP_ID=MMETSP0040_2-20121228/8733_1 /TAXON_ID=641309 /ORGANISM="Lotharella oceanica, Strain CCMP622" /LENGTH=52 /DNA_ID=CAMNT_0010417777 /DNA_START=130 /DNA_END=285 /DNA_ORIENTATION=-
MLSNHLAFVAPFGVELKEPSLATASQYLVRWPRVGLFLDLGILALLVVAGLS